jgi:hypothetical protein
MSKSKIVHIENPGKGFWEQIQVEGKEFYAFYNPVTDTRKTESINYDHFHPGKTTEDARATGCRVSEGLLLTARARGINALCGSHVHSNLSIISDDVYDGNCYGLLHKMRNRKRGKRPRM